MNVQRLSCFLTLHHLASFSLDSALTHRHSAELDGRVAGDDEAKGNSRLLLGLRDSTRGSIPDLMRLVSSGPLVYQPISFQRTPEYLLRLLVRHE